MSQVQTNGPQFDQGEGGAGSTKGNGSHMKVASDVTKRGSTGDHMAPLNPATRPTGNAQDGKSWNIPFSDKTAVRGGGGIGGHSRDPGPKRSGSKNEQNPNVLK